MATVAIMVVDESFMSSACESKMLDVNSSRARKHILLSFAVDEFLRGRRQVKQDTCLAQTSRWSAVYRNEHEFAPMSCRLIVRFFTPQSLDQSWVVDFNTSGLSASKTCRAKLGCCPVAIIRSTQWVGEPMFHLAGAAFGSGVRSAISKPQRVDVSGKQGVT